MGKEIQTIAVIGAGDAGRKFACAALRGGFRTILEDVSERRLADAAAWILNRIDGDASVRARLALCSVIEEAVRGADLIVEAVAEEMEMKIEVFTIFDRFARPDAILASCSPFIPIAELAEMTFCPERCIGLRLGSGADGKKSLELVRGPQTSEETVARCRDLARRLVLCS